MTCSERAVRVREIPALPLPKRKSLSLAREAFPGGGTCERGARWSRTYLFRLLRLIGAGDRGSGVGGELFQVVLQEADFDAASANALGLRSIIRRCWSVAHANEVDAIDGNLVVEDEVAHDRLGHLL